MPKVELQEWGRGEKRILTKLLINGKDLVGEFVEKLERSDKNNFVKSIRLLEQLANEQLSNHERCKRLQGTDKLFELRDHGGLRIYFFYEGTNVVVLCAGNIKGDGKQDAMIKKSSKMKKDYHLAKSKNQLVRTF